ncbi:MAG: hypothetical protein CMJ27_08860 [Phycisphaerae bacterium]|nr:hypothetical protein [Phycisphaerae bacterium]OUX01153.1 MAG: hypothetical protein CBD91_05105 [Phycisphaeraceae bacterium TMED231]
MAWLPTIIVVSGCLVPAFGGVLLLASRRAGRSDELERRRTAARELTEHRRRAISGRTSADRRPADVRRRSGLQDAE